MKKKLIPVLPFAIMPVFIPVYSILDSLIFVDVFGCGCVPDSQTNMLNIAFNANDLRVTVFFALAVLLFVWSAFIAKGFPKKVVRIIYCAAAIVLNLLLAAWVAKNFMWA